jgi:hypothetical protein
LLALLPLVGSFAAFETALAIAVAVTEQEAEAAMVEMSCGFEALPDLDLFLKKASLNYQGNIFRSIQCGLAASRPSLQLAVCEPDDKCPIAACPALTNVGAAPTSVLQLPWKNDKSIVEIFRPHSTSIDGENGSFLSKIGSTSEFNVKCDQAIRLKCRVRV